jgi:hypothetical protein
MFCEAFQMRLFFSSNLLTYEEFFVSSSAPKSIYIIRAVSHFYGTEFDIWAGLGRLAVLKMAELKLKYATFEVSFFLCFHGHFFLNIVASTLN